MRLQIALDTFDLDLALATLDRTREWIDIAEVGTGLGNAAGARAITALKSAHPDVTVLSDIKIMDGGEPLAAYAFDAGADIVSVLGVTDDATVAGALRAAEARGKEVLIDMIGVPDVAARARALDALGAHYICVHTPHDLRETVLPPTEALAAVQAVVTSARTVVTGGIKLDAIDRIVDFRPDVVVVGSGIMAAADPADTARRFAEAIHGA